MTALRAPGRPLVAVLPSPGWCTQCAVAGEQRPAADPRRGTACRDHLRVLPARPALPGQLPLFDVERVSRLLAEYPTGEQLPCAPCAAAGRDELGLRNRIEGDPTPLCLTCWRRRERQAGRRGTAAIEWVEELPTGCVACGSPDPVPGCWLCGWSWLADGDAENARWLQEQQAAVDEQFAVLARRQALADRETWLTSWVERVRGVLAAYAEPGLRSTPGAGWGRAVELLADIFARDSAIRSSSRGRPSAYPLIAAVMAVDADYRSGRRAMPGRAECAELAGCGERAVTSAWARGVRLGSWIRTSMGRRLTLAERKELQRGNDRAVYDLRPVHRSTDRAARDRMVPAALRTLDALLEQGMQLLADAQHALSQHDAVAEGVGRATSAQTATARAERARLRQAVTRTRSSATVLAGHLDTPNKCSPHTVSRGECVSSCLGVQVFTFVNRANVRAGQRPRRGRGKGRGGASRSSTKSGLADLDRSGFVVGQHRSTHPADRPRTDQGQSAWSQGETSRRKRRKPPEWANWAYRLADELRGHWEWLRYQPLDLVASTLGARLGDRWTAAALVDFVHQSRAGRPLPVEQHTPIGLLLYLLDHALTGDLQPPYPARRHTEHQEQLTRQRHARQAEQAAGSRAAIRDARAENEARSATAADARAGGLALARAALAGVGRSATAAAEDGPDGWPKRTEPGTGLPHGWRRGDA